MGQAKFVPTHAGHCISKKSYSVLVRSDVTSLTHGLGKRANEQLVPIDRRQKSYFKDSFELKKRLDQLELQPSNDLIITCDTEAMYTNLQTEPNLLEVSQYIQANGQYCIKHCNVDALLEALPIVFWHNYFKFGDLYCHQTSGTAMGTPPAPPWATITFAIHEDKLLQKWGEQLPFYRRFIDDGIGIWQMNNVPTVAQTQWAEFKQDMQGWHGLNWTFTEPATKVDFMDLKISIVNNKVETTIFEKAQNLYLYIPPHSSHPKGVLTGLVFGQVLRIRRLCTHQGDANEKIMQFTSGLMARGHSKDSLLLVLLSERRSQRSKLPTSN